MSPTASLASAPAALIKPAAKSPALSDYPALALAATNGANAGALDTRCNEFAGLQAALETINRLNLGARNTHTLTILARSGPQPMGKLAEFMRLKPSCMTGIVRKLEALGMVGVDRRGTPSDTRQVIVTATEAARNVLASIMSLTALAMAANIMTKHMK